MTHYKERNIAVSRTRLKKDLQVKLKIAGCIECAENGVIFQFPTKALAYTSSCCNIIPQKTAPPVIGKDIYRAVRSIVSFVNVNFPPTMFIYMFKLS